MASLYALTKNPELDQLMDKAIALIELMLQLTGDAKYTDIMKLNLFNSVLSGISLEGTEFFYTNPFSAKEDLPFQLRWPNKREGYISRSNCFHGPTVVKEKWTYGRLTNKELIQLAFLNFCLFTKIC